jgi:uncharacterized protein (DUF885 family)
MLVFDRWAQEFAAAWVRMNPQQATNAQYFSGAAQAALDAELALCNEWGFFYGETAAQKLASIARDAREKLSGYSPADLSSVERASAAALDWYLSDTIANAEFAAHRFVFSQIFGFHVLVVNFLAATHPIRNARDVATYLARLGRLPKVLDDGIAEARAAARAGVVPPTFILERTIEQLDALTSGPPANHVLVAGLVRRMRTIDGIASQELDALAAAACDEVRDRAIPAFARVREFLAAQLPASTDAAGAWSLPNGEAYYARQLACATGTSLGAMEIHEIGLREVDRLESELERVLNRLGYAQGTISQRLRALNETRRVADTPDSREAILRALQAIMDDATLRARDAFHLLPNAPVVIRREPEFSEKSAAAHYATPAPDGSAPGIYWVPLADLDPNVPWLGVGLKSTAYHEAIPGHHFQLAIEQESSTLPYFRKRGALGYNPAFNEGWALYAERLCAENGWYDGDLPGYAGYLQQQLFRARRLVVDTGIHQLRWTKERAVAFGFTAAEIERYASWPGQACAYMIGQLRILELREKAKATLGKRFALEDFHDVVLAGGTLPLGVLAEQIESWLNGP